MRSISYRKSNIKDQVLVEKAESKNMFAQARLLAAAEPYHKLTKAEANVYFTVYPLEESISDFDNTILPPEVIEEIAEAIDNSSLVCLQIRHRGENEGIVIGYHFDNEGTDDCYLVCHWGNHIMDYRTLKVVAKELYVEKLRKEIDLKIEALQKEIDTMGDKAANFVNGL